MELKDTYNKIARDWFKDHNDDTWWIEGTEKLISLLPPHAKILDIGCGAGHKAAYLASKGFEVVGGDFSEEMIKIAKEQVLGVEFKILDLYELDSLKETFDCVFAQAVFLHIPKKDIVEIFTKVKGLLKKGGLFYIAVKEAREGSPDEAVLTENGYGYEYQRFFSYFSTDEIHRYLSEVGFEVVDSGVTDIGHTRWVQVIAKL